MKRCDLTNQSGIILMSTLLVLAVLTSLMLTSMQGSMLSRRALNQWMNKTQTLSSMEATAQKLLSCRQEKSECIRRAISPNAIMRMLQQKQACYLNEGAETYYYLIEDIGIFPCITMRCGNKICSTAHRRLSLFNPTTQAFLQIRLAEPVARVSCEGQENHRIKKTILSWRYLKLENTQKNR